jgi:hypothetical protein
MCSSEIEPQHSGKMSPDCVMQCTIACVSIRACSTEEVNAVSAENECDPEKFCHPTRETVCSLSTARSPWLCKAVRASHLSQKIPCGVW